MPAAPSAPVVPPTRDNAALAIGLKVISVCFFLAMASLLKGAQGVPPGELAFFRSFFAVVPILAFLIYRGELVTGVRTQRPFGHLWRGLIGVGGMACGFFALTKLPLPEAIAINYAMPLLIVVFGAVFLHENVRLYRWSAVLVGLVGVGIIIAPRFTLFADGGSLNEASIGALVALCGCCFGAVATLHVRKLIQSERSATIVFYFSVTCTLGSLLSLPFGWIMPSPPQFAMLIGAGIAGGIGQILMTEAYRHADVSVIAPFEYTSLLLSIGVGYVFFADIPTLPMLFGGLIVVAAGIFIILRERALGLERSKARSVSTPQG